MQHKQHDACNISGRTGCSGSKSQYVYTLVSDLGSLYLFQMLCCHEDATVYVGRELLESMPAVMHAKLSEVINEQLGQPLSERFVRVLASLLSCPTEDLMATALQHLQVAGMLTVVCLHRVHFLSVGADKHLAFKLRLEQDALCKRQLKLCSHQLCHLVCRQVATLVRRVSSFGL